MAGCKRRWAVEGSRRCWRILLVLTTVALAGSGWSWALYSGDNCGSCRSALAITGGVNLAPVGVAYYSLLLSVALACGPCRVFFHGVALAASVHLVLLGLLVQAGLFCAPCVVTGLAVLSALAAACLLDHVNLARASALLPIAGLLALAGVHTLGVAAAVKETAASERRVELVAEAALGAPEGRVRLTAYVREGCHWCDVLEAETLPAVTREFGDALVVEMRRAPQGIPTPTIVVTGKRRSVFPYLPRMTELRTALELALGKEAS